MTSEAHGLSLSGQTLKKELLKLMVAYGRTVGSLVRQEVIDVKTSCPNDMQLEEEVILGQEQCNYIIMSQYLPELLSGEKLRSFRCRFKARKTERMSRIQGPI